MGESNLIPDDYVAKELRYVFCNYTAELCQIQLAFFS